MSLSFTHHPILEAPTDEQIATLAADKTGQQALLDWHEAYHERLRKAVEEPLDHGFVLDHQKMVEDFLYQDEIDEVWVFGGWRSGKSRSAAKIVVESALANPNAEIICWAQNEDASVERQQPYIWEMLPKQYKQKMKGEVEKINYSKGTGFAGKKLILPNGAVIYFKFYSQFQNDDTMLEGANLGALKENVNKINMGSWLDEYLGDETLLNRVRGRCMEKNSKVLITFTPVDGYTPTVGTVMDGATTLTSKPASLLGGRMMPTSQQPGSNPSARIVFYHTEDNPWANFERLSRDLRAKEEADIMKLAYGFPTKSMTAMFSSFSHGSHVYKTSECEYDFSDRSKWTTYQVIDPAGTKAWSCIWASVNDLGDIRVWAEFPERDTYGEWAVEGKSIGKGEGAQWRQGPAAKECGGLSLRDLQTEWTKIEGSVEVTQRIIDIRFAHNPKQTKDHGEKTLQDELADMGVFTESSMGATEDVGLPLIQEALSLPDRSKPFDYQTNRPRMMFSEDVGNCIFSVLNYCKNGKKDEALKDFIDLLRYLMTAEGGEGPMHIDPNELGVTNITKGGY